LREAIIAYRLEHIYDKKEILALYLNTVPFAENIFGIEVAAERFFSKKPSRLDVHEAAVLIGMLKANNYYNPRKHPQRAIDRRNTVLAQMEKYSYLTAEQANTYKTKPL
jgi:penicillin-binding protein 1A